MTAVVETTRGVRFALLVEASSSFRLDPITPSGGHTVITLEEGRGELLLYVRGLRPLRENRPPGHFFYEAWFYDPQASPPRAVSAGAFNVDETGAGRAFFVFDPRDLRASGLEFRPDLLLLVTAECHDGDPEPSPAPALLGMIGAPAPVPAVISLSLGPGRPPQPEPPATEARAPFTGPTVPFPTTPQPSPEAATPAVAGPAATAAPAPPATAAVAPAPSVAPPVVPPAAPPRPAVQYWQFGEVPPPPHVCPPGYAPAEEFQEALFPLRDRLDEATANAVINFRQGTCLLTIRGVPLPSTWGMEATTERSYNVYQGWVRNSKTGEWASLGYFGRIWHDTYRLQYRGDLPLYLFDTLIVSPEDRASTGEPARLQLFSVTYSACEPAPPRPG